MRTLAILIGFALVSCGTIVRAYDLQGSRRRSVLRWITPQVHARWVGPIQSNSVHARQQPCGTRRVVCVIWKGSS